MDLGVTGQGPLGQASEQARAGGVQTQGLSSSGPDVGNTGRACLEVAFHHREAQLAAPQRAPHFRHLERRARLQAPIQALGRAPLAYACATTRRTRNALAYVQVRHKLRQPLIVCQHCPHLPTQSTSICWCCLLFVMAPSKLVGWSAGQPVTVLLWGQYLCSLVHAYFSTTC